MLSCKANLEVIISDAVFCHLLPQGLLACVIVSIPCQLHVGVLQCSCGEVWWCIVRRHLFCRVSDLSLYKALQQMQNAI
jgi:hypothetical protein